MEDSTPATQDIVETTEDNMDLGNVERNSLESIESLDEGSIEHNNTGTSSSNGNTKKFAFYEFGAHATPFHDILESMHKLKDMYKRSGHHHDTDPDDEEAQKKKKSNTKTFSINDFQASQKFKSSNAKISKFRPAPLTWDGSFFPDAKMLKQLYRTPCRDPSGKVITSLGRDEAKGVPAWKPPEVDRNIPDPKFTACSHDFQVQLLKHMDEVIEKVEREYAKSTGNTQAHSNLKARMGADLNNLKQKRDKLKRDLAEIDRNNMTKEEHK